MLNGLNTVIEKSSVGLCREDGLGAINNANGLKLHRIRKDIIVLFKEEGLSIIMKTNTFLFKRLTIHTLHQCIFNHPPTIIKQWPKTINKRISDLSCNKEEFGKVKSVYETALKVSGHFSIIAIYVDMSFNNSNKTLEKKEAERLNGSTHHIAKM